MSRTDRRGGGAVVAGEEEVVASTVVASAVMASVVAPESETAVASIGRPSVAPTVAKETGAALRATAVTLAVALALAFASAVALTETEAVEEEGDTCSPLETMLEPDPALQRLLCVLFILISIFGKKISINTFFYF